MANICEQLKMLRGKISLAEREYGREPGSVTLVVATKMRGIEEVRAALTCDQKHFGENYMQDALSKITAFPAYQPVAGSKEVVATGVIWHFIGPIQSNKTKQIATNFVWVESVDRLKIAERLNAHRPDYLPPLNVCIEVNISGESSKAGVQLAEAYFLAQNIKSLPRLKLRGLMAIPAPNDDFGEQRQVFARLKELFDDLNTQGLGLDTLSMGMSDDYEAAIAEGATSVRLGTAIFGPRPPK